MTTLASLLFAGIFIISISVMMLALSGAAPRIREIILSVHSGSIERKARKITVMVPTSLTADIVQLPLRAEQANAVPAFPEKIAA